MAQQAMVALDLANISPAVSISFLVSPESLVICSQVVDAVFAIISSMPFVFEDTNSWSMASWSI